MARFVLSWFNQVFPNLTSSFKSHSGELFALMTSSPINLSISITCVSPSYPG